MRVESLKGERASKKRIVFYRQTSEATSGWKMKIAVLIGRGRAPLSKCEWRGSCCSCFIQGKPAPLYVHQNLLCGFGPHQRCGMGMALGHVRVNGRHQLRDTAQHAATKLFGRQVPTTRSLRLSHALLVGWNCIGARGWRVSHRWTVGCVCVA